MLNLRDNDTVIDFEYYYYQPSMAGAVIFVVLFGLSTSLHIAQMLKGRSWFMIPFVIGGLFETVGYIGLALSARENPGPYSLGPYLIQTLLILIAPALLAATIYMELGRIVLMTYGDRALFIKRTWLTKVFVSGDILSFLMQSAGGSIMSSGNSSSLKTGKYVVVGGLFVQIIFFGVFVIAAACFHIRMNNAPTRRSHEVPWKKHMLGLYIVSILIFVRSIVRAVEYLQGYGGYIMRHPIFLFIFDGLAMWLAVFTMNLIHPNEVAQEIKGAVEFRDNRGYHLTRQKPPSPTDNVRL